jgi:uncharacterized membrane protein
VGDPDAEEVTLCDVNVPGDDDADIPGGFPKVWTRAAAGLIVQTWRLPDWQDGTLCQPVVAAARHDRRKQMEHVEETVEVAVPVRTAYNQWTQFESFPQFMSGVESITQLTDTTNHWVTKVGGVQREFDTEIVDQEPDDRIAWRSTDGKSHAGIIRFTPLDANHTKVRVHFEWAPETATEKAGAALRIDEMQVKADMRKFKDFVESRGGETGGWRGEVKDKGPTGQF